MGSRWSTRRRQQKKAAREGGASAIMSSLQGASQGVQGAQGSQGIVTGWSSSIVSHDNHAARVLPRISIIENSGHHAVGRGVPSALELLNMQTISKQLLLLGDSRI